MHIEFNSEGKPIKKETDMRESTIKKATEVRVGDIVKTSAGMIASVKSVENGKIIVDLGDRTDNTCSVTGMQDGIDKGIVIVTRPTDATAEAIIEELEQETTEFLGQATLTNNDPVILRDKLTAIAEAGRISPKEYWRSLKLTRSITPGMIAHELSM